MGGIDRLRRMLELAGNISSEDIERLKGRAERVEQLLNDILAELRELRRCLCSAKDKG